jgi:hypothetical protein
LLRARGRRSDDEDEDGDCRPRVADQGERYCTPSADRATTIRRTAWGSTRRR